MCNSSEFFQLNINNPLHHLVHLSCKPYKCALPRTFKQLLVKFKPCKVNFYCSDLLMCFISESKSLKNKSIHFVFMYLIFVVSQVCPTKNKPTFSPSLIVLLPNGKRKTSLYWSKMMPAGNFEACFLIHSVLLGLLVRRVGDQTNNHSL